ncbi:motility associated factor glycosyltransferase family protein [Anaeromicropila herbilytica]|uniref:6-hydroxymethylpterin diphosphokinase MptE-like domain-containing protein n=1 Tax=Anaeromicropila herbilytica TaxID=2785025 RepID=A0A7R7EPA2_9FIRM|nr:6-hydroxymethylpterin diphosphokinase MptE-like protein [Anaeromicropila herbilytica]BCN32550.1 hypothetical protein bsdtb5_38450 [Anaeromicropila herbilytica]
MTIYEKNYDAIKNNKSNLFKYLEKIKKEALVNKVDQIESIATKDGNQALVIVKDGSTIRLNSAYKPISEANKWAEQFEIKNINAVVSMFGFGNGIFAREMINKLSEEDILLIYEPSAEIFLHVLEHYDITDILNNRRVSITVEEINDSEFKAVIGEHVEWINMNSQMIVKHPQYMALFEESHKRFIDIIRDNNEVCQINKNTERKLSGSIIRNTIENMKYMKDANILADFEGDFGEDIPAIIVSAGPSLDKNIEDLKVAKGKAVIFCTDTALKYLFAHDIIPDFIVTLDPNKYVGHFEDERCNSIPLFCLIEANKYILEKHKSRKIFYNTNYFITKFYEKLEKKVINLNSGGSVATGAFSICASLGFKKIILIGQDLAYSGKSTHAGGRADFGGQLASDARKIEDINGDMVYTRGDWYLYLNWFVQAIESIEEIEVIDATEGGAKIKGTKIMTLKKAIADNCRENIDCSKIVDDKSPTLAMNEKDSLENYLQDSIKELNEIKRRATENKRFCEKLVIEAKKRNIDSEKSQSWVKRLTKNNNQIEDKPVYSLIDIYIAEVSTSELDDVYVLSDDEVQDQINTYEKGTKIYSAMIDACKKIEEMIREEIKEIKNF